MWGIMMFVVFLRIIIMYPWSDHGILLGLHGLSRSPNPEQNAVRPARHPLLPGRVVRIGPLIELIRRSERERGFLEVHEGSSRPLLVQELLVRKQDFRDL